MSFNDEPTGFRRQTRVRFGAISEGWALFKEQWLTWVVAGLIVTLGHSLLMGALQSIFHIKLPQDVGGGGFPIPVPPARSLVPAAIVMVVDGILLGGLFRLACLQMRGRRISASELFGIGDVIAELALGSVILGVALAASATFCAVIPAFILAGVWMFTIPLIVDGRLRALDALSRSWHALKREWFSATLFHLVVSFLAGLGFCCGCVGGFFTMPLYCLSIAVLYRDTFLTKTANDAAKPTFPDPDF